MRKSSIILLILMLSVSLVGQQRTGNIFGRVNDSEGRPLPGVTVRLVSPFGPPML